MKLWKYEGQPTTDVNDIFYPLDGAYWVLLENEDDVKCIVKAYKRTGYEKLYYMTEPGLYKRGGCDYYEWVAPMLVGLGG